jgi:hypothetical protein
MTTNPNDGFCLQISGVIVALMLTVFALEVDTETVCFAKLLALAYEACTKFKLAFKFLTKRLRL